jgi:hypothetical protein
MIIEILQTHFKPKSSLEEEKLEYNELNILAEYQLYNLLFAKNEILLDNVKTASLLHMFWKLLELRIEQPVDEEGEEAVQDDQ